MRERMGRLSSLSLVIGCCLPSGPGPAPHGGGLVTGSYAADSLVRVARALSIRANAASCLAVLAARNGHGLLLSRSRALTAVTVTVSYHDSQAV